MSNFQGLGRWAGSAEVYSGDGKFLGNGADTRHVQKLPDGRTRIDVSFVGPFKHAGHYFIEEQTSTESQHPIRLYQGPANIGYAETLSEGLVDAKAYWAALGLSQRFFLMVLPGGKIQLSLALMSRGEHLLYVVVGQNDLVPENNSAPPPSLISGTSFDLANDPSAGHGQLLLHRACTWKGELTVLNTDHSQKGKIAYQEHCTGETSIGAIAQQHQLHIHTSANGFVHHTSDYRLVTNHIHAWTPPEQAVAGSYSLSGGRALSGHFYYPASQLRVWRREVVTHDGLSKAVVNYWYRGDQRIGTEFGLLTVND